MNDIAVPEFKAPEKLTDEELGQVLDLADSTIKWLKSVQEYAKSKLAEGKTLTGWKLVLGRTSRDWADEEAVKAQLNSMGYKPEEYTSSEILSPAELEKQLGKPVYSQLEAKGLAVKTPGRPTLAKADDPRKAPSAANGYEFLYEDKKGNQ